MANDKTTGPLMPNRKWWSGGITDEKDYIKARDIQMEMAKYHANIISQQMVVPAGMLGQYMGQDVGQRRLPQYTHMQKLLMRLNMHPGDTAPFHALHIAHIPAAQTVAVFFVYNNKPIVFEDGEALFPSDGLIGKLSAMR